MNNMRTDAVVALQIGIAMLWNRSLPLGRTPSIALGCGVCIAELVLTGLLFRNTVLSSLVLPSQLTSKPPPPGLCGSAVKYVLSRVNGGEEFTPWQQADDIKNAFASETSASV